MHLPKAFWWVVVNIVLGADETARRHAAHFGPRGGASASGLIRVRFCAISLALTASVLIVAGCGGAEAKGSVALHRDVFVEDATGDAPASADITSFALSDTSAGVLTFQIGLGRQITADTDVVVFFDTDRNKATGAGDVGAEYALEASGLDESDPFVDVRRWTGGSGFDEVGFDYAEEAAVGGGVLRVRLNGFERFGPGFNLVVATLGEKGRLDQAPDSGQWSYRMKKQVRPALSVVGGVKTRPSKPRAGRRFIASIRLKGSSGVDVSNDSDDFTCAGTFGEGTNDMSNDEGDPSKATALCSWRIPAGATGKMFRGSLNVGFRGATLRRSVSATIGP